MLMDRDARAETHAHADGRRRRRRRRRRVGRPVTGRPHPLASTPAPAARDPDIAGDRIVRLDDHRRSHVDVVVALADHGSVIDAHDATGKHVASAVDPYRPTSLSDDHATAATTIAMIADHHTIATTTSA